jgi:ribulose-5-phosphate 4-epimerase/fuculose-1-phosphate aldolase
MPLQEGYVKYTAYWDMAAPPAESAIHAINELRSALWQMNLIGAYTTGELAGIGFGNISTRAPFGEGEFIISGTQTGDFPHLSAAHYTTVVAYNISENWLHCRGEIQASSESLTHAAVYESAPDCSVVIHIHHKKWWDVLCGKLPTTPAHVPYGTPEMGEAVQHLYRTSALPQVRVFAMGGHDEGLIAFGDTPAAAWEAVRNMQQIAEELLS